MSTHAERVREAFSAQADAFEDAHFNHLFTTDASWLFASLPVRADDLLLGVAAGTGHAARELAPRVRAAVALDVTREPSGLQPHERDGELRFVQRWASLLARKPAS